MTPHGENMVGERIQAELDRLDMTQDDLAEAIGVAQQTVSKWINGVAEPRTKNLRAMEDVFDIDKGALNRIGDTPTGGATELLAELSALLDVMEGMLPDDVPGALGLLPALRHVVDKGRRAATVETDGEHVEALIERVQSLLEGLPTAAVPTQPFHGGERT